MMSLEFLQAFSIPLYQIDNLQVSSVERSNSLLSFKSLTLLDIGMLNADILYGISIPSLLI